MKRKSIIVLSAIIFSMAFLSANNKKADRSVNQVAGIGVTIAGCCVEGGWGEAIKWTGMTAASIGGGGLAGCALGLCSGPIGWGVTL